MSGGSNKRFGLGFKGKLEDDFGFAHALLHLLRSATEGAPAGTEITLTAEFHAPAQMTYSEATSKENVERREKLFTEISKFFASGPQRTTTTIMATTVFKAGDHAIYNGPSQGGVLAPGDSVIVDYVNPYSGICTLKFPHTTHYTFWAPQSDLAPIDKQLPLGYSGSVTMSEETEKKRKEAGECLQCGTRLRMSIHGLLPCERCQPR